VDLDDAKMLRNGRSRRPVTAPQCFVRMEAKSHPPGRKSCGAGCCRRVSAGRKKRGICTRDQRSLPANGRVALAATISPTSKAKLEAAEPASSQADRVSGQRRRAEKESRRDAQRKTQRARRPAKTSADQALLMPGQLKAANDSRDARRRPRRTLGSGQGGD